MNVPGSLHTPAFSHYSVAWSPFHNGRLALASAANYGLVGNGRLHVASLVPPTLQLDKTYDSQDGLYDIAWSEIHENQIVTASGDGSIKLWDVMLNDLPIRAWHEHTREVFSVDWSNIDKEFFISSSWDGTVKLWTPNRPHSVQTLHAHSACIYQALFSPHHPSTLATCSLDGTLKIFDLRAPSFPSPSNPSGGPQPAAQAALTVPASVTEILTLDWNKYRPFNIATAGVEKNIKIWDCRMVKMGGTAEVGGVCEREFRGHEYAVRKIQWCPHRPDLIASASYDMTCRVWSTTPNPPAASLLHIHDAHTEFVVGCAWSLYDEGLLASCSWDCKVNVYRV
ncbi:WD40 repeat-like protein [Ramaria rubella]|nr:WD40 repeat-like protein [Ramaria rubella]